MQVPAWTLDACKYQGTGFFAVVFTGSASASSLGPHRGTLAMIAVAELSNAEASECDIYVAGCDSKERLPHSPKHPT